MRRFRIVCFFVFAALILTACGGQPPPTNTDEVESLVPSPTVDEQPTQTLSNPLPTEEPTPTQQPGLAVLLAPPGSSPVLTAQLSSGLQNELLEAGLDFEVRSTLLPGEIPINLHLVVAIAPDPGMAALAASASQVQFLAVGIPGLQSTANLSLVSPQGVRTDRQGFIAGAVAAMVTEDWRVAVLGPGEPASALAAREGFLNGAVYFCGLCLPYHGPTNIDYPLYIDLPLEAGGEVVQTTLQVLEDRAVKTVYVPPGVGNDEVFTNLAEAGLRVIGSDYPPPGLVETWIASVRFDPVPSILDILPTLLAGEGGHIVEGDLVLSDINPDLFSPGRQVMALEILADLTEDFIDTGVNPLTGERR